MKNLEQKINQSELLKNLNPTDGADGVFNGKNI